MYDSILQGKGNFAAVCCSSGQLSYWQLSRWQLP